VREGGVAFGVGHFFRFFNCLIMGGWVGEGSWRERDEVEKYKLWVGMT
jgi:hypothetical protein